MEVCAGKLYYYVQLFNKVKGLSHILHLSNKRKPEAGGEYADISRDCVLLVRFGWPPNLRLHHSDLEDPKELAAEFYFSLFLLVYTQFTTYIGVYWLHSRSGEG